MCSLTAHTSTNLDKLRLGRTAMTMCAVEDGANVIQKDVEIATMLISSFKRCAARTR
jgi:hypothetical protein